MSDFLKPQSPMKHSTSDEYFYPLTTVDQVIMPDGSRLNANLEDIENTVSKAKTVADEANTKVDTLTDVVKKFHSNIVEEAKGELITLADASDLELAGLKLYGKTVQNGTPTLDTPVALESAGGDDGIAVTLAGKNLWPHGDLVFKGSNGVTSGLKLFLPAGDYTLSRKTANFTVTFRFFTSPAISMDESFTQKSTLTSVKFSTAKPIYGCNYAVSGDASLVDTDVQIEFRGGVTPTEYEPYKGQNLTIATPNGLPGIPVTSGGNYTDPVTDKQWICDEVDFANGKYIKRVHIQVFNGNEAPSSTDNNFIYLADKFEHKPLNGTACITTHGQAAFNSAGNFAIPRTQFDAIGITDTTAFKKWVGAQSGSEGKIPFTVLYRLAEETTENLTAEELAAYATLHTNYPNTAIYNDAGADMEVKYVADTKLFVEKKFNELAAVLINNT